MHAARPTWTGLLACALALASCGPDAAPEPAEDPTASHGAPPVAQGPTPAPPPIDEPGPEPPPPPSSGAGDTLQEIFAIAEASREGPDAAAGFQAARARLQEVLDHHPDDPALHAAMGHLWVDELRWRRLEGAEREMHRGHAEQAYQRALVLDPDHVRANAGLGDLLLGLDAPAASRNLVGLLEAAPDLAAKALRLRSLGQKICEIVGGRGTHPVTAVAGGMSNHLSTDMRDKLRSHAAEAMELAQVAVNEGKKALVQNKDLLSILPLPVHNVGTVKDGKLDLYDGVLRVQRGDGTVAGEFDIETYKDHLFEEALPYTYTKQVFYRDPNGKPAPYRVGALARINCADGMSTPKAQTELEQFKARCGNPSSFTVMHHYARLIELLHCAERALEILEDDDIMSGETRAKISATPKSAIAHVEAPRGVLIHDYQVDKDGIMTGANFIVATQHNISSINASIKAAANLFLDKPDEVLLNGVEFAIRCYDPCLSCSTHQVGRMPLSLTIVDPDGEVLRQVRR